MARQLIAGTSIRHLSLDEIAWQGNAVRRPINESISEIQKFVVENKEWVIEGCYGDLVEEVLKYCTELRFLNPGTEACVANCRKRSWEPEKFATAEEQNQMLEELIRWVKQYDMRDDEYGLKRHRQIFDLFNGPKREYT